MTTFGLKVDAEGISHSREASAHSSAADDRSLLGKRILLTKYACTCSTLAIGILAFSTVAGYIHAVPHGWRGFHGDLAGNRQKGR